MIRQKSPSAPIGGCLWGVQCFLDNAVGDLCVGGVGVFHGEYEKDPKNTADYYKVEESGIFWHSKDICEVQRFNGRDQLTFTSRANCVVKIRGAKVDLAAIEQTAVAVICRPQSRLPLKAGVVMRQRIGAVQLDRVKNGCSEQRKGTAAHACVRACACVN